VQVKALEFKFVTGEAEIVTDHVSVIKEYEITKKKKKNRIL
jgi:hypothetical protein